MDPNPWTLLLERTLSQSTAHTLHLYTSAASTVTDPESVLERLDVVWLWQIKQCGSPYHEFFVIETVDPLHRNEIRRFILERVLHANLPNNYTEDTEV